MGKIFDALEKTDRKKVGEGSKPLTVKVRKNRQEKKKRALKKVVPMSRKQEPTSKQIDKSIVVYHDPHSIEAELFKVLRTNILFSSKNIPPRTILVTSAIPDDGKSFISANLAVSIAYGIEDHVLLIDGDIRKPDMHQVFGLPKADGLSEYLATGNNVADVLQKTPIDRLTILPAGKPAANPTELMSSRKMKVLLQEVKERYDDRFIIIDSPPPSMAVETNAIAKYVDGIIMVVSAGVTPRAAVEDTIEKIGKEKVIGIVLNRADQTTKQYYGYNKSYYK